MTAPATTKAGAATLTGRLRTTGGGRPWRVHAYSGDRERVKLKDPRKGYAWTDWYPRVCEGETLAELFVATETYLDAVEAGTAAPAVSWVAHAWLDSIRGASPGTKTYENRECLVRKWVDNPVGDHPPLGSMLLEQWTPTVSADYFPRVAASGRIGEQRMEDLRTVLAAIRDHARTQGLLPAEVDPLRGVRIRKGQRQITAQSQQPGYKAPNVRPTTSAAESLIAVAAERWQPGAAGIDPLQLRIGCYVGPRLSEQLGLAVEDLDLRNQQILIRGAWTRSRHEQAHWRPWTKTRTYRTVAYPGSWQDDVCDRVRTALGLPPGTGFEELADAVAERHRVFDAWYDEQYLPWHNGQRREAPGPMPTRHYLFPYRDAGLPSTNEQFNDAFRALREETIRRAEDRGDVTAWPAHIPYKNARHHAATWMHANLPSAGDPDWVVVAAILGNRPETCRRYYVIAADGAVEGARRELAAL